MIIFLLLWPVIERLGSNKVSEIVAAVLPFFENLNVPAVGSASATTIQLNKKLVQILLKIAEDEHKNLCHFNFLYHKYYSAIERNSNLVASFGDAWHLAACRNAHANEEPIIFQQFLGSYLLKHQPMLEVDLVTKISQIDQTLFKNLVDRYPEVKAVVTEVLTRKKVENSHGQSHIRGKKKAGDGKAKISLRMDFSNFK